MVKNASYFPCICQFMPISQLFCPSCVKFPVSLGLSCLFGNMLNLPDCSSLFSHLQTRLESTTSLLCHSEHDYSTDLESTLTRLEEEQQR